MAKIKLADGKTITDGQEVVLTLWSARHKNAITGADEEISKTISGVVHSFEHIELIYNEKRWVIGEDVSIHWELLTGDENYPAIGFIPETSKLAKA